MDADQFTELLQQHAGLIHKIAYAYCRNASDRDDVIQEIAVQLWRSRDRYDDRYRQTTWIYRIALNVAISFHRRTRRHDDRQAPIDDDLPGASPEGSDDLRRLLRGIDQLAPLDRALVLLYLDGNDHAAIADVLGISVSNVGTKLGRIKDRLRAALDDAGTSKENAHGAR